MATIKVASLTLRSDGSGYWSGTLRLPTWRKAFGSQRHELLVEMPGEEASPNRAPAASRLNGCRWLIANESSVLRNVLAAVRTRLPELRRRFGADAIAVTEPEQVSSLIEPTTVVFHTSCRGRRPYIGYGFRCSWDEEHGLGLMMHGLRVVEVGGADTAILEWIADQDSRQTTAAGRAPRRKRGTKGP